MYCGIIQSNLVLYLSLVPIVQVFTVSTMTYLFTQSLLRHTSGLKLKEVGHIRAVVMRTAAGAAINVILALLQSLFIYFKKDVERAIGAAHYFVIISAAIVVPFTLHISISHRDDKPILFVIEMCRTSGVCGSSLATSIHAYRAKTIETFEEEHSEVTRLPQDSLQAHLVDSISFNLLGENEVGSVIPKSSETRISESNFLLASSGDMYPSNTGDVLRRNQTILGDVVDRNVDLA